MKLSKKGLTVLSFTVGACLFVSTAFADSLLGSGYDRLKDSAKKTASMMEGGLGNYTVESLFTLKDNDKILEQSSATQKFDTSGKRKENITVSTGRDGKTSTNYSYEDSTISAWKNSVENKYYVTEYPSDFGRRTPGEFKNPFNENGASEVEKIVDAVVGNLKDYVQVEEGANGSKVYAGSLSEAQVPALANAVASFGFKRSLHDDSDLAVVQSDIFVKKVVGSAVENKAGYLENVTGDITLSGKDKNGVQHELTLNVVAKLSNVGSTTVVKPDLTGAEVQKANYNGLSSKYVGTYKNNIIMEKDGKFVKIGERTLQITNIDGDKVKGTFAETVLPGFEKDYPDKDQFSFEYTLSQMNQAFTYTNAKGETKNGMIHPSGTGKVYVELNLEMKGNNSYRSEMKPFYDNEFNRAFE
ncbi:hypothetical protein [Paenibacillus whitsoniae]|uniref:Uncharacterized protein n=1 Tax=Paenibacillus whitsoniae TaxID=2496558 RepID=A0A3S0BIN3_9BACL|nr:hypothetical protein [Paenibacillus whitsoniae]RTE06663.1 hypothetical protein EJQ19_22575 [Paenibacillus whitsoniae]